MEHYEVKENMKHYTPLFEKLTPEESRRMSANEIEDSYNRGSISLEEVKEWCRASATSPKYPRVYVPLIRSAPEGIRARVWLKRLDIDSQGNDVPNYKDNPEYKKLFAKEDVKETMESEPFVGKVPERPMTVKQSKKRKPYQKFMTVKV